MTAFPDRLAGAPITWGVCEVPGWGCQLDAERVLSEVAALGLRAIELGPPGFLAGGPDEVARTLRRHDLRLAAGFVPATLHRADDRALALDTVSQAAETLAAAGADVLVLAAELANGAGGYDRSTDLSDAEWSLLFDGLEASREVAARHGLPIALHPHYGTAVERSHHVERVLAESDVALCVDTGHLLVGGANPLEVARAAKGRVVLAHLKDVDAELASRVRRRELSYQDAVGRGLYRPLGDGDVDIAGVVRELEGSGYSGWYVLEQDVVLESEPASGAGPAVSAARSLTYLKGIMNA